MEWKVTRTKSGRKKKAVSPPARRLKDQTAEEKNTKNTCSNKSTNLRPPSAGAAAAECVDRRRVSTGGKHDSK